LGGNEMRIAIVGLATCLAIIQPQITRGQDLDSTRLQEFTRSNFYAGLLNRTLASIPPAVFKKCPTLASNGAKVTTLKPISFDADGLPNAGSWMQSFPVSEYGNDTILQIYFPAGIDEKINTVIALGTRADLGLQKDAYLYAKIGAKLLAKDCRGFDVRNTRLKGLACRTRLFRTRCRQTLASMAGDVDVGRLRTHNRCADGCHPRDTGGTRGHSR
jgi:hypothetical protein